VQKRGGAGQEDSYTERVGEKEANQQERYPDGESEVVSR